MTEPGAPLDSGEVAVPRSGLVELRTLVLGVVFGSLVIGGAGIYFAVGQDQTNEHLSLTDQVVVDFLEAELLEEDQEQARACVDAHERYALFEDLAAGLTRAGATTAATAYVNLAELGPEVLAEAEAEIDRLLPEEIAPLLHAYPPPGCDLEEASRLLAQPAPEPPDIEGLLDR